MSQELQFVETESGEWFYILEHSNAPKNSWDWMDYADAFGPFPTLEAAQNHEYKSGSDTSGAEIVEFSSGRIRAEAMAKISAIAKGKS